MEEYSSNSRRSKEGTELKKRPTRGEIPTAKKVVQSDVKIKKRTGINKVASSFINEDLSEIGMHLLFDRFMPAVKEGLYEGFGMLLGVDIRRFDARDRNRSGRERVQYGRYYDERDGRRGRDRDRDDDYRRSREGYEYEDVVITSRGDIESIFDEMQYYIKEYGQVRVADLCGMLEITSPYTGNDYGWLTMRDMDYTACSGGYRLRLPRPVLLSERR